MIATILVTTTTDRVNQALRKGQEVLLGQPDVDDLRSRLAAIVDSSNDVIISKNLDGVISTWNLAAQQLFGYSEAEVIGQPITIIIPADLHDEEKDILRRLRAGERIEHFETHRVTRDGRTLDVSITISPVRDATGTIVRLATTDAAANAALGSRSPSTRMSSRTPICSTNGGSGSPCRRITTCSWNRSLTSRRRFQHAFDAS